MHTDADCQISEAKEAAPYFSVSGNMRKINLRCLSHIAILLPAAESILR